MIEQEKLTEYTNRKAALEVELETIKTNIIITEQNIKQQESLFIEQFQTTDINKLSEISASYEVQIKQAEKELAELEESDV